MTSTTQPRTLSTWVISMIAIVFGLMTLKAGGSVLFGVGDARAAAGHYISFVLWFNFLAGFAYVVAGVGLWQHKRWAFKLSVAIAVATALASLALAVLVVSGTEFEQRTAFAMGLRTVVWVAIAVFAWRKLAKPLV